MVHTDFGFGRSRIYRSTLLAGISSSPEKLRGSELITIGLFIVPRKTKSLPVSGRGALKISTLKFEGFGAIFSMNFSHKDVKFTAKLYI